jgi:hypothetical protein
VAVVGFAPSTQFRLDVELVLPERQLRPVAQIALGQARSAHDALQVAAHAANKKCTPRRPCKHRLVRRAGTGLAVAEVFQ